MRAVIWRCIAVGVGFFGMVSGTVAQPASDDAAIPKDCRTYMGGVNWECVAGERLNRLRSVQAQYEDISTMSLIGGVTFANVCPVLLELGVTGITDKEARECSSAYAIAPDKTQQDKQIFPVDMHKVALNAQKFLGLSAPQRDGWLKTHEWVRLVCTGVEYEAAGKGKRPASNYQASWMFATGMGLSKNENLAWYLADKAAGHFESAASRGGDEAKYLSDWKERALKLRNSLPPSKATFDLNEIRDKCSDALGRIKNLADGKRRTSLPAQSSVEDLFKDPAMLSVAPSMSPPPDKEGSPKVQ